MAPTIKKICESSSLAIKRLDNFWTVGSASYKDRKLYTNQEYTDLVTRTNGQLIEVFPDFYKFQLEYFSYLLKAECQYMPEVSIPGFHVFKHCPEFEEPVARPHVDAPFNLFDWGRRVGKHTIFTHVAALEIPPGAGMRVWNVTGEDIQEHGFDTVMKELPRLDPVGDVVYRKNELIVHSGLYLHQINPFLHGQEGTWRITLQSHAVLLDGTWYLYW